MIGSAGIGMRSTVWARAGGVTVTHIAASHSPNQRADRQSLLRFMSGVLPTGVRVSPRTGDGRLLLLPAAGDHDAGDPGLVEEQLEAPERVAVDEDEVRRVARSELPDAIAEPEGVRGHGRGGLEGPP